MCGVQLCASGALPAIPHYFNMSSMHIERIIAISDAAKDDHLTVPALAALCRHYGLEVSGVTTEDSAATIPESSDSMPFAQRVLDIARACGGEWALPDTKHPPLADEVLDMLSIFSLGGVARKYGLIALDPVC